MTRDLGVPAGSWESSISSICCKMRIGSVRAGLASGERQQASRTEAGKGRKERSNRTRECSLAFHHEGESQSTISKRYSSMTVLVSTSFEMCSSCFCASSRFQPSRFKHEKFSLADVAHRGVAETGEGVLNGLSLRIEYGAFWHYPDVCFHAFSITLPSAASRCSVSSGGGGKACSKPISTMLAQFVFLQPHARGVRVLCLAAWCETWRDRR